MDARFHRGCYQTAFTKALGTGKRDTSWIGGRGGLFLFSNDKDGIQVFAQARQELDNWATPQPHLQYGDTLSRLPPSSSHRTDQTSSTRGPRTGCQLLVASAPVRAISFLLFPYIQKPMGISSCWRQSWCAPCFKTWCENYGRKS